MLRHLANAKLVETVVKPRDRQVLTDLRYGIIDIGRNTLNLMHSMRFILTVGNVAHVLSRHLICMYQVNRNVIRRFRKLGHGMLVDDDAHPIRSLGSVIWRRVGHISVEDLGALHDTC